MLKVYISGPMTGLPDYNYPAFHDAEAKLAAAGYDAVSPAGAIVNGWEWSDYMRRALKQMLDCDAVALLPGWNNSAGARVEVDLARSIGMPVRLINAWLP